MTSNILYINDLKHRLSSKISTWKHILPTLNRPMATIDFETRSTINLKQVGGWVYSKHETTEAMCMAYRLPGEEVRLWHKAHPEYFISESPMPEDLFAFILAGGLVEAHNAFFERCIWKNILVKEYGWIEMPHLTWRCSAAKCSALALPRALGQVCEVMDTKVAKDDTGYKLMLKMCKPRMMLKAEIETWVQETNWQGRTPGKKNPILPTVWHETEEDICRQWKYCEFDVLAEESLSEIIPELSEYELRVWQMDQLQNERGVKVDRSLVNTCIALATKAKDKMNKELELMTGIHAGTQRQAIKNWLLENENLDLPNTTADTLEWYIEHEDISGRSRRILEIIKQVNKTSISKYSAMLQRMDPDDDRVRDILMYHGAERTGRWAGRGIQVHNFPRGKVSNFNMDEGCKDVITGDVNWCDAIYEDTIELLSACVRGSLIPEKGKDFIAADYSAIEARCVLWEAGAEAALEVFRQGGDIYCDMATGIYGYPVNKKEHSKERQFGKQAILGLGYCMGFMTFFLTCRKYKIKFSREDVLRIMGSTQLDKLEKWARGYLCMNGKPTNLENNPEAKKKWANKKRAAAKAIHKLKDTREDPFAIIHELALMKHTVNIYRARYSQVKDMWKAQEAAAIKAMLESGRVKCGVVTWFKEGIFLFCELPSGRCLSYPFAEVKPTQTSWGEIRNGLRYMSIVNGKWLRTATYGGKLVENITQAIARDLLADAMLGLAEDNTKYLTAFHVHDEIISEVDEGTGNLQEFEGLMANTPAWAQGCPVVAEAEIYKRFRK